jgi:ubiquinone/menaquinone biosynthesis C-methylase UbiE
MGEEGDYHHKNTIDPAIYSIIGDPQGKSIYDIGCGNGYMARHFAKNGARKIIASDVSEKLIQHANKLTTGLPIEYRVHDATDFEQYHENQFDAVVMSMVIHYIEDLDKLFLGISKILKHKGIFAFSTSHFFRPPHPYSSWVKGKLEDKERLFIQVTDYLNVDTKRVGGILLKSELWEYYNHPLNQIVNTLSNNNLYLHKVIEPESGDKFATDFDEELRRTHHIPTFLIMGAKKL